MFIHRGAPWTHLAQELAPRTLFKGPPPVHTEAHLAAQAVAIQKRIPKRSNDPNRPGKRELLAMLGLLNEETGELIDNPEHSKSTARSVSGGKGSGTMKTEPPPNNRAGFTTPEGLRKIPES